MDIDTIYQALEDEKACRDILHANYLSKDDYEICNYIINHISVETFIVHCRKTFTKKEAINESLKQIKILNNENYQELLKIIKNAKIINDFPLHNSAVSTSFEIKEDQINEKGNTIAYHLPKKIYEPDIICIAHEHCHALKDSNYKEYKNTLITGEVIPIFIELIDYETNSLKEKYLNFRIFWLKQQKSIYLALKDITNNNENNIHEFAKSYYCSYIGSFYYATILYSLYKQNPITILNLINDVLSHKITTIDMLNKLNIYCNVKEDIFEKEINNIKKTLTK